MSALNTRGCYSFSWLCCWRPGFQSKMLLFCPLDSDSQVARWELILLSNTALSGHKLINNSVNSYLPKTKQEILSSCWTKLNRFLGIWKGPKTERTQSSKTVNTRLTSVKWTLTWLSSLLKSWLFVCRLSWILWPWLADFVDFLRPNHWQETARKSRKLFVWKF